MWLLDSYVHKWHLSKLFHPMCRVPFMVQAFPCSKTEKHKQMESCVRYQTYSQISVGLIQRWLRWQHANQELVIPPTQSTLTCDPKLVNTAIEEEAKWQSNTRRLISEGVYSIEGPISWAAFNSNQEPPHDFEVTIGSLLPLFPDDSKSVAGM